MPIIQAKQKTVLKRSPVESSQLPDREKFHVDAGTKLGGIIHQDKNGHLKVKLAGNAGELKAGDTWYVFAQHWDVPQTAISQIAAKLPLPAALRRIVASKKDYDPQDSEYTCQSACIASITGGNEMAIRAALDSMGSAGDPAVMGAYLRSRVKEYRFMMTASLNDFIKAIDDDYQLITHGWYSRSGHIVRVVGYERDPKTLSYSFICDDPYEEFDAKIWDYHRDYRSGNNVLYSAHLMYATCVAGQSFEDARRIYRRGELDSNRAGAWLHLCRT